MIKHIELEVGQKKVTIDYLWKDNLKVGAEKELRCFGGITRQEDVNNIASWILSKVYTDQQIEDLIEKEEFDFKKEKLSSIISTVLTFNQGF